MTIGAFDTLGVAKRLEEKGFTRDQAEEMVRAIGEGRKVDFSDLATKQDIEILRRDMTIKFGTMLAAAVAVLFGLLKAFP